MNNEIYKGLLKEDLVVDLDISLREVIVEYLLSGKVVLTENVVLTGYSSSKQKEEESYENSLIEKVQNALDNPIGTPEEIEFHTVMLKNSAFDVEARKYVEKKITQLLFKEHVLSDEQVVYYTRKIYSEFYGMGVLQELDDDPTISEIMVNGYIYPNFQCDVYYVKNGEGKKRYEKTFESVDSMINVFSRSISFSKKELNNLEYAIIEATRANGDRVNVIIPEASESYVLNIRKFTNFTPTSENMKNVGTIDDYVDKLMNVLVKGKANIGIGGEMNTGKTSFINYLLGYTDPIERKVIISSVKEVSSNEILKGHDIVFLKVDDEKHFTFSKLIKTSLRTTANRIIIPESRAGEFKQVYEANLKTRGNMFTAHALTDSSFLNVCADMYLEGSHTGDIALIKNKIANSVDIIIIMKRINNKIRIKSISEVLLDENDLFKGLNLLYYWDFGSKENPTQGYKRTDNRISDALRTRLFEEGVLYELLDDL